MEGFSFKDTSLFLPLRLGPTARDTLQEFIDIDVTAEDLVRILHRNQVYGDLFARFVNQKTQPRRPKGQPKPGTPESTEPAVPESPTHRLISLLGMIGSRNLILSLRMHKALEGRFPVSEDGEVELKTLDYLKRAMETEELFLRSKLEYSETAYSAAVYYDWKIRHLSKQKAFKKIEPYCETVWKRALRTGLLAYFLAEKVKGILPKQAMAAGFVLHGGKLTLAGMFEDYPEFEAAEDARDKLSPLARLLRERERYGVAQEEVSSYSLRFFDLFQALNIPVRYFREPYCLKGADEMQYRMASLLYLADAMARSWKIPADVKDPVIQQWGHPSLRQFKFTPTTLIAVMKSAMTVR